MGTWIELKAADGHHFKAWQAMPAGKPKGAIVVIQEIFGVNAHIRDVTERYAALGYVAIAPAIFDRYERDFDVGYAGADFERGMGIAKRLNMDTILLDTAAAKAAVAGHGKTGIVGYCLGGTIAWLGATRLGFDAAEGYYGGRIAAFDAEVPKCPVQLHFGEKDANIPLSVGENVKAKHPDVEVFVYPADHGFACDARAQFDEPSRDLAWSRVVPFFAQYIG
jgi:carboxymethylenebutenolidase